MKKINNLIKVIFTIYLIIAFAGFIAILLRPEKNDPVKEASNDNQSTTVAVSTTAPTTKAQTTTATPTTKATTAATTTVAPTTTAAPATTTVAPTTTTAPATEKPTEAPTQIQYDTPYEFANGTFSRSGNYTYTIKNAAYVNLHESADGNSPIMSIPGDASGKVLVVGAYYSYIEYNGNKGYVYNKYLELH